MAMNTLISAVKAYVERAVAKLPSHEDLKKAKDEAEAKYLKKTSAAQFVTRDEADEAYAPNDGTLLTTSAASNTYLTKTSAQSTYASKTDLENLEITDVVKDAYTLRIGEKKYSGYGFAILYGDGVLMNYTSLGIYDEGSGSHFCLSGQSVLKNSSSDKKGITINVNGDGSSSECGFILTNANGKMFSISADGTLSPGTKVLKVGYSNSETTIKHVASPTDGTDAANKAYVDAAVAAPVLTSPSGKRYKLTVDDSGTLSATEVTE